MDKIRPYLKALFGFLTPGATVLGLAVTEGSQGNEHITAGEWVTALVACVVTGSLVFAVPNRDPKALHQQESVQPPEAGYGELGLVIGVLLVVILVVVLLRVL